MAVTGSESNYNNNVHEATYVVQKMALKIRKRMWRQVQQNNQRFSSRESNKSKEAVFKTRKHNINISKLISNTKNTIFNKKLIILLVIVNGANTVMPPPIPALLLVISELSTIKLPPVTETAPPPRYIVALIVTLEDVLGK